MNRPIATRGLAASLLAGIAAAHAGENVVTRENAVPRESTVPRKTFRESSTYPYIFRPEGYLATDGPVPMRIDQRPAAFLKRTAPPLPVAAKGMDKPIPGLVEPREELPEAAPEKETRGHGKKDELPLPEPDLGKIPEAVMRFFRDKDPQRDTRPYLFDPIFLPAPPNELSRSKASSIQKP